MAPALGSRRFSLGYTNVPWPRVSVTQTCTIVSRGPAESPVSQSDEVILTYFLLAAYAMAVRRGYLDLDTNTGSF